MGLTHGGPLQKPLLFTGMAGMRCHGSTRTIPLQRKSHGKRNVRLLESLR